MVSEAPHHYLIFETAGGFCGIAWNNVGITRFQLPTKSAAAAERTLLRRVPGAEHGAPTPEVIEAIAAVKRYFEGEQTDWFAAGRLILGHAQGHEDNRPGVFQYRDQGRVIAAGSSERHSARGRTFGQGTSVPLGLG